MGMVLTYVYYFPFPLKVEDWLSDKNCVSPSPPGPGLFSLNTDLYLRTSHGSLLQAKNKQKWAKQAWSYDDKIHSGIWVKFIDRHLLSCSRTPGSQGVASVAAIKSLSLEVGWSQSVFLLGFGGCGQDREPMNTMAMWVCGQDRKSTSTMATWVCGQDRKLMSTMATWGCRQDRGPTTCMATWDHGQDWEPMSMHGHVGSWTG